MNRPSPADLGRAVVAGFAGAVALTIIHESARHLVPHAPRTDVLGSRAIAAGFRRVGLAPPAGTAMYALAIAADLLSNGGIYAAIPIGDDRTLYRRSLIVGLLTGVSALVLPPLMGLGHMPGRKTPHTQAVTLAWYGLGGIAAAAAWRYLRDRAVWRPTPSPQRPVR